MPRGSNVAGTRALLGCDLPVAPATLLAHRVAAKVLGCTWVGYPLVRLAGLFYLPPMTETRKNAEADRAYRHVYFDKQR